MKKFIYGMFASCLLLTSCSQEDLGLSAPGEEANVSISLTTPQLQTRAYSDGTTATHLQYAVYEKTGDGDAATYRRLDTYTVTDETINISKKIDFRLVNGKTYTFVFWAASPNADNNYAVTFGDNGANMKVTYDSKITANNEDLDAFYVCEDLKVTGDVVKTFELRRPFAQINVGTNDYAEAAAVGYAPSSSRVVVTGIYDTLNLISGDVEGTAATRTFGYKALPKNEEFPVPGYDYLAMAYVLVPQTKDLQTVQFSYGPAGGTAETRQVGSVPIQRNFRTNLFGQVLTSNAEVNVIIEPDYNEPDYTVDELVMAAALGGTINLNGNVGINQDLVFRKDAILNLNGNTLNVSNSTVTIAGTANVTINGEGTIAKTGQDAFGSSAAVYVNSANASVTINGGNITSDGTEAVYVQIGTAYITGGYYAAAKDYNGVYYTLNCNDANFKTGAAKIIVTGGTFENFDPANTKADKNSDDSNGNLVAPGYKSVPVTVNGKSCYTVIPASSEVVESVEDLYSALQSGKKDITLVPGTYTLEKPLYDAGNQRFNGFDSSVTLNAYGVEFVGDKISPNFHGATVKGLTIKKGENAEQAVLGSFVGNFIDCKVEGGVYAENGGNNATFDNCTFICDNATEKMAFHIGSLNAGNTVTLNNCYIDGRCDFGVTGNLTFNKCTLNVKANWELYGTGTYTFNNCTINYTNGSQIVNKGQATVKGIVL